MDIAIMAVITFSALCISAWYSGKNARRDRERALSVMRLQSHIIRAQNYITYMEDPQQMLDGIPALIKARDKALDAALTESYKIYEGI